MTKIIKYLKPYWPMLIVMVFLLLGQAMAELFLPTLMADIVNNGIVPGIDEGVYQTAFILRTGGFMLLIALLAGGASITAAYIAPRISAGAARDMRRDLFSKVENFSQGEFDKFSSASLITRCTNDVAQVQNLANVTARLLLYAPLMGIGGIIMALSRSVSMSWIIALAVIVLMGFIAILISILMSKFKILQEMVDRLNKIAREILHGLMVIRAFGTQRHEKTRFDKINTDLRDTGLFIGRVMAFAGPLITFVMGGTQILVIWVGADHVAASGLPVGDMMAFMQYAMQVIIAFMMMSFMIFMVPRALVSAARIAEVLDTELTITDPSNPEDFPGQNPGKVDFEKVSFRYPGAETDVISGISFIAHPGQTTAIIGATGSGKSTVANLLLRFYDVTEGQILVDGTDIRRVRQEDLRGKIGYVPQKGQLLGGTIASNIRYGMPDATDEEIETAASVAQALEFIEEKEEKYESEIAQGGTNVSGGQRQRLSIARALAKNPEILVFDDSFSALDFKTDVTLRKALKEHTADATVIVIAQRVGTIMNAEQILVLDEGQIVGRGTHEELLVNCPAYHEIASSQGTV
ncbi:MAG: ABC transporter ATP-binding protein/permease [Defluviitaleaceae bacterium]|nr:ABC transporter ATP-binding protein/permease [Defluviitaleaceae bacterium]